MNSKHLAETDFAFPRRRVGATGGCSFPTCTRIGSFPSTKRERARRSQKSPATVGHRLAAGRHDARRVDDRSQSRRAERRESADHFTDLSHLATWHCNDMVVDAKGRAYVGNFGFDLHAPGVELTPDVLPTLKKAGLVMIDEKDRVRVVASELAFPNGTVITPDGGTLIVAETMAGRLTAFDIALDGSLHKRRIWAQLEPNWKTYPRTASASTQPAVSGLPRHFSNESRSRRGVRSPLPSRPTGVLSLPPRQRRRLTLFACTASGIQHARMHGRTQ